MVKHALLACLLLAWTWAVAKEPTPLMLPKGARVGVVSLLDAEVTHYHPTKDLSQSFLKTQTVAWPVDSMLMEAVGPQLTQMGLVPVAVAPSDALVRGRDDYLVNNSVAKGLSRQLARDLAELAAQEHLVALVIAAPGVNNSSQAGGAIRRALPDYLRGWGFITAESGGKPALFNMTQILLVSMNVDGAVLSAREWGGSYADEWQDYVAPPDPKQTPAEQLDRVRPQFAHLLARQAGHLLESVQILP